MTVGSAVIRATHGNHYNRTFTMHGDYYYATEAVLLRITM
jgi:hypothetical protein